MKTLNYSASYLVKRSTKQLNYFLKHSPVDQHIILDPFEIHKTPSERQIKGNQHAKANSKSKFVEMLGRFKHRDISIYFSIDEIKVSSRKDYLIEHKWLESDMATRTTVEDLSVSQFFKESLIQTAFLGSLACFVKDYKTAGFVPKEEPHHKLTLKDEFLSRLHFGDKVFDVKFEPLPIVRFFLTKARCSKKFMLAKQFDETYKDQEWDKYFKDVITYKRVDKKRVSNQNK